MEYNIISLKLKRPLDLPLEARCITPDIFAGKTLKAINELKVQNGKYCEMINACKEENASYVNLTQIPRYNLTNNNLKKNNIASKLKITKSK